MPVLKSVVCLFEKGFLIVDKDGIMKRIRIKISG